MKKSILLSVLMMLTAEVKAVDFDDIQFVDQPINRAVFEKNAKKADKIYKGFIRALEEEKQVPYDPHKSPAVSAAANASASVTAAEKNPSGVELEELDRSAKLKITIHELREKKLQAFKLAHFYGSVGNGDPVENQQHHLDKVDEYGMLTTQLEEALAEQRLLQKKPVSTRFSGLTPERNIYDYRMPGLKEITGHEFWEAKSAVQKLATAYGILRKELYEMDCNNGNAGPNDADELKENAANAKQKMYLAQIKFDWLYDMIFEKYVSSEDEGSDASAAVGSAGSKADEA